MDSTLSCSESVPLILTIPSRVVGPSTSRARGGAAVPIGAVVLVALITAPVLMLVAVMAGVAVLVSNEAVAAAAGEAVATVAAAPPSTAPAATTPARLRSRRRSTRTGSSRRGSSPPGASVARSAGPSWSVAGGVSGHDPIGSASAPVREPSAPSASSRELGVGGAGGRASSAALSRATVASSSATLVARSGSSGEAVVSPMPTRSPKHRAHPAPRWGKRRTWVTEGEARPCESNRRSLWCGHGVEEPAGAVGRT